MSATVLVTGGCGYVGSVTVDELLESGRAVRVLDSLLHGQSEIASEQESRGVEVVRADIRDDDARRRALAGVEAVVHLAAVVGDPACKLDPELSDEVNVDASRALVADAARAGVSQLLFASTCSNYGRMPDPTVPIAEDGELRPQSLYSRQKVVIEQELLKGDFDGLAPTCLRFSTVHGVSPRMRFDLTVNEFSRDLWADRELVVFGKDFWRSYIHVRDAARAVRAVLDAPRELVAHEVFNAGSSSENYRKLDVLEAVQSEVDTGSVKFVETEGVDPRDYQVSCEKIRSLLGFETVMTVPGGVREVIEALSAGRFPDPFERSYRNIP